MKLEKSLKNYNKIDITIQDSTSICDYYFTKDSIIEEYGSILDFENFINEIDGIIAVRIHN